MRNHIYTLFISFVLLGSVYGQDPLFNQFYSSPVQSNPAMIGVFNGQFRGTVHYRNAYASVLDANAFKTISGTAEFKQRIGRDDFAAFGVTALSDNAGSADFRQSRFHVGGSYHKQLVGNKYATNNQFLIGGFTFGIGQQEMSLANLWFENQFNETDNLVDYTTANGESLIDQSINYLDFNAGLMYYAVLDDDFSFYIGGAFHHLNKPDISFLGNNVILEARWLGMLGGQIPFSDELSLLPAFLMTRQGENMSSLVGANIRYTNSDWREVAIRAGLWPHISNSGDSGVEMSALVVSAILEMERFQFAISYDVATQSIESPTNSRGAYELSVIYVHPYQSRYRLKCPKL